ncbi:hypothetical protein [Pallidibacillus pasinlerensis]|uniref:YneQ n=1 Tax=Pallidibacillus pasinlerensis TaxID=2703818 RepID=A0ABX0A7M5_9BACI|nr:hypothetical protein [Pallidibacillus pasinlerensis]NCU18546.1 hypothetical protein [Pallidibacillus pasinlerensis]
MAFGITRNQLNEWKRKIDAGEIAFLTHYWYDERFPDVKTVTKVGCKDIDKLVQWGKKYGLKKEWIDYRKEGYSHFDLIGEWEKRILEAEGLLGSSPFFKAKDN